MSTLNTAHEDGIPQSVKIFTWVLICAGLFFAYVYTFNPG